MMRGFINRRVGEYNQFSGRRLVRDGQGRAATKGLSQMFRPSSFATWQMGGKWWQVLARLRLPPNPLQISRTHLRRQRPVLAGAAAPMSKFRLPKLREKLESDLRDNAAHGDVVALSDQSVGSVIGRPVAATAPLAAL